MIDTHDDMFTSQQLPSAHDGTFTTQQLPSAHDVMFTTQQLPSAHDVTFSTQQLPFAHDVMFTTQQLPSAHDVMFATQHLPSAHGGWLASHQQLFVLSRHDGWLASQQLLPEHESLQTYVKNVFSPLSQTHVKSISSVPWDVDSQTHLSQTYELSESPQFSRMQSVCGPLRPPFTQRLKDISQSHVNRDTEFVARELPSPCDGRSSTHQLPTALDYDFATQQLPSTHGSDFVAGQVTSTQVNSFVAQQMQSAVCGNFVTQERLSTLDDSPVTPQRQSTHGNRFVAHQLPHFCVDVSVEQHSPSAFDSQSLTNVSQNHTKQRGKCGVCLRMLRLNASGNIWVHGPANQHCLGSGQVPVPESRVIETNARKDKINLQQNTPQTSSVLLDAVKNSRIKTLKRLPKASRAAAADKLVTLLSKVCNNMDDTDAWFNLVMFAHCCFGAPKRGGKRFTSSLATKLNNALDEFPNNKILSQNIHEILPLKSRKLPLSRTDETKLATRVSEKIEDGDIKGAVRLAASDDSFAACDEDTVRKLRAKHPPRFHSTDTRAGDINNVQTTPLPLVLQEADIHKAILSFPNGSAGGLDGLRPQHLKDMCNASTGTAGERLQVELTRFANLVLAGQVPLSVRPVFFGASLCALTKKDGGVRPIAVGCTLRRLVAKAAAQSVSTRACAFLAPKQLGFGVKQGAEAATHAVRAFLKEMRPDCGIVKLDFQNAFNMVHRDNILQSVRHFLPDLFSFVNACYSDTSCLVFGRYDIESDEGAQQGDPLGPLLFCCVAKAITDRMKSALNVWYLDDGTLGGNVEELIEDIETVQTEGSLLGLCLNEAKCEIITNSQSVGDRLKEVLPNSVHVNASDAVLLGAPLGDRAQERVLSEKLADLERLVDRLKSLDAHDALFLLKNCFSIPKLLYTLRCSPCYTNAILKQYDQTIRLTLQTILNVNLDNDQWRQATLPVRHGGLGVRSACDIALPAFLASMSASDAVVASILPAYIHNKAGKNDDDFKSAILEWARLTEKPENLPEGTVAVMQKKWDEPLMEKVYANLLSAAPTQAYKSRLLAVAAPHAGDFLHAVPVSSLGTRMDPAALRIAIALRLGSIVCAKHECICGEEVDETGLHGLNCKKSAGRNARHSAVNDCVKRALTSAKIPSCLEPTHLSRDDGKRPDGLTLMPWTHGKAVIWDFTCVNTLARSYLDTAVTGAGHVANTAENKKKIKYAALSNQYTFVPIGAETLGALGNEATRFLNDLGKRIAVECNEPRSGSYLFQRVSVAIQRGNAACVLGTSPEGKRLDSVYYI